MRSTRRSAGLVGFSLLVACGGAVATAGPDSGNPVRDSGHAPDTAIGDDAPAPDASPPDARGPDARQPDAQQPDVTEQDAPAGNETGPAPDSGVPIYHRTSDAECTQPAPPGDCGGGGGTGCSSDSACTMGTNGRCIMEPPLNGCRCTYDACMHDTDCPHGELCVCHGSSETEGRGNTCAPGNCRVDSDCGVDGYCSPSSNPCGGVAGYYCHTTGDKCVNNSDCGVTSAGCAYSTADGRWECQAGGLCG